MARLDAYRAKRDPSRTPEPFGGSFGPTLAPRYSMQKHDATRLHFDLRLEFDGVLLSWAVTRGPSLDPKEKRLAVRTEDHPLDYLPFEGVIPKGEYGAGRVMLFDLGYWQPDIDPAKGLKKGHLAFRLHGRRLTGAWDLVRIKPEGARENWILIKKDDEAARRRDPVKRYTRSVSTNRTLSDIGKDAPSNPFGPKRTQKAPKFKKPQLAQLSKTVVQSSERWTELKFDGYRALAALGRDGPHIYTRNGHDWSERFGPLLPALSELPAETALIDGEITVGAGLQGFGLLQEAISRGGPFTFYAFDLLSCDGADLTKEPLTQRRSRLEALLKDAPPLGLLQASPILHDDPAEALWLICTAGGEGVITKLTTAPYRSGRSSAWLKHKCERRDEFVIVGYQPSDKVGRPFSSLLLASMEDGRWRYRGKVGTGFDGNNLEDISARLSPIRGADAALDVPRSEARGAKWVTPKLIAEVKYAEMTGEGLLRHAVFLGLREDKMMADLHTETTGDRTVVAGISVSSGDRVVFPRPKITKLDVARYYEAVADRMLATAANRPISLLRLPEGMSGERFFQKHAGKGFPDALRTVAIEEADGDVADYMYVTDAAGLVGAAQMGTIEFHVWGARRDRLDRPDRLIFDLDPDEGLSFSKVKSAARDVRDILSALDLQSAPLLTGGKGVHVVVPLRRTIGWDTLKGFAHTLAALLATREPKRFTAELSKARRKGKIFIDYLRNERGATAIAPWSLRARPGAPVAVPVTWDELDGARKANVYSLRDAVDLKRDQGENVSPQTIGVRTIEALENLVSSI